MTSETSPDSTKLPDPHTPHRPHTSDTTPRTTSASTASPSLNKRRTLTTPTTRRGFQSAAEARRNTASMEDDDSGDEDTKASAVMGDWLTSLPLTAPYHRGNVLVVPESPYKQRRAGGRASSAKLPRTGMKHYTEISTEETSPPKPPSRKYPYSSPQQIRSKQEKSDIHDELQHQQAMLLREKTKIHHAMHGEEPTHQDVLRETMLTKKKLQRQRTRPGTAPVKGSSSRNRSLSSTQHTRASGQGESLNLTGSSSVISPVQKASVTPRQSNHVKASKDDARHPVATPPAKGTPRKVSSASNAARGRAGTDSPGGMEDRKHSAATTRPATTQSAGGGRSGREGEIAEAGSGAGGEAEIEYLDDDEGYDEDEFDDELSSLGDGSLRISEGGGDNKRGKKAAAGDFLGEKLDDNNPLLEPYRSRQKFVPSPGEKTSILQYPSGGYHVAVRASREEREKGKKREKRPSTAPATHGSAYGGSGHGSTRGSVVGADEEEEELKICLDNFEELCRELKDGDKTPRINSPHSMNAMRSFGAVEGDLKPVKDLEVFMMEWKARSPEKRNPDEDEETRHDRLMQTEKAISLRWAFAKDTQGRIMEKLREERERHRKASIILIPDSNTIGERPALQLKSYGKTAQRSYVQRGVHGKKERMEQLGFGSRYAEELASSLVEKGRQKVQRLEAMEKKRIAALLKKHIATKDTMDDLQERINDKNDLKEKRMQERMDRMRRDRLARVTNNGSRFKMIEANRAKSNENRMSELKLKHQRATEIHEQLCADVRRSMQNKAIHLKLSQERHRHRLDMANRAQAFKVEEAEQRIARQQVAAEKIQAEREKTAKQREDVRRRIHEERTYVTDLVENFRETGQFSRKKQDNGDEKNVVSSLICLDTSQIKHSEKDRNPTAVWVQNGEPVDGYVERGKYVYYKFKHFNTQNRISVCLTKVKGDPDVAIGNNEHPYPTMTNATWQQASYGNDKITIHPFDRGFVTGILYVGIFGTIDSSFNLTVKWVEDPPPPVPTPKSAGPLERRGRVASMMARSPRTPRTPKSGTKMSPSSPRSKKGLGDDSRLEESMEEQTEEIAEEEEGQGEGKGEEAGVQEEIGEEGGGGAVGGGAVQVELKHGKTGAELSKMTWEDVAEWLRDLEVHPDVLSTVRSEKVPGSQVATMTIEELMEDLGMSKLQAKRVNQNRITL